MRTAAVYERREGPRVLIAGPPTTGKTTLVRTLASYATRQGFEPIVVNADPKEGMLSLPGTLSASVFATVMDPEAVDGWGTTPTSGPSTVPVKLPLVYYYGRNLPDDDPEFYRELTSKIAGTVSGRLSEDDAVRSSGVIVDSMGVSEKSKIGEDLLAHIVDELSSKLSLRPTWTPWPGETNGASQHHRGPGLQQNDSRALETLFYREDFPRRTDSNRWARSLRRRG